MKKFSLGASKSEVLEMFSENVIHKIHLEEITIALVRKGEQFFAFQGACPHRAASLFRGTLIDSTEIRCPLHGYRFDIQTGEVRVGFCDTLEIYPNEFTAEGLKIFMSVD
ncbi:Rieske (2Fe-2S) protein [Algoriphagus resistens]|uniref:Rieske (2Fe-2S) protein n=1 Tax=Algoriphagus resistens TaxID=1750590 RepID=UPI0007167E3A|nr:Rieske (2Fe-2S) protein [Algoriphagus resistens]